MRPNAHCRAPACAAESAWSQRTRARTHLPRSSFPVEDAGFVLQPPPSEAWAMPTSGPLAEAASPGALGRGGLWRRRIRDVDVRAHDSPRARSANRRPGHEQLHARWVAHARANASSPPSSLTSTIGDRSRNGCDGSASNTEKLAAPWMPRLSNRRLLLTPYLATIVPEDHIALRQA